jgi:hypothetical protein
MALQLAPDEPEAGPWRAESLTVAAATVMQPGQGTGAGHRPVVLAVDGRSSSGKTTLAGRLRDVVAGSAVVHTDDIAWWHSRFGWADLLIDGVLLPARAGQPVTFRPPPVGPAPAPGGDPGPGRLRPAHHRGRRGGPPRNRPSCRRSDLGPVRRAGSRAPQPGPRGAAGRAADRAAPPRLDGRGDTVRGRPATLGTCRPHRLRQPGDLLRSRDRARRRTLADPDMTTTRHGDRPGHDHRTLNHAGLGSRPVLAAQRRPR